MTGHYPPACRWRKNRLPSTNLQTWVPVHTNSGAFPFLDPNVAGNRMKFYKGVQR